MKLTLVYILTCCSICLSQQFRLSGSIFDAKSSKPLEYVTVKVADTTYGTTADKNGNYILKLDYGSYKVIFSMVGYFTDTQAVYIESGSIERNVYMNPSEIFTETIEVIGEDPAYDIMRKAIKYKKEFRARLKEYDYDAYTKYVIRSDFSPVKKDSLTEGEYPILAILESETKGYYKKPDGYKEIVKSKRETANIPRGAAIPVIVNFYDDEIRFNDLNVTSPLADDALDYYEYRLTGITSIDSTKVYKIEVIDGAGLFPLFYGTVYIMDSVFALVKVDLNNNEAAKPLGIDDINFKQKFNSYIDPNDNKFWMPTDVQVNAKISFAGVFKLSGDVFTIISSYSLNKKAPKGIFDEYYIKVLPDAKKDSSYWKEKQLVKSSKEENEAYKQIDKDVKGRENKFRLGLTTINFGRYISSNPLSFYSFNRVEGSRLQFNLDFNGPKEKTRISSNIAYSFSDKKMKYEINYKGNFLKKLPLNISAGIFQMIQPLSYYPLPGMFRTFNTATSLLDKRDFYDYYYASGWRLSISKMLIPQIGLTLNYSQEKQTSALKNTDYSFRKKDQPFRENPSVNDAFQRLVGVSLYLDPNKYGYIDYGDGEIESFPETEYPALTLRMDYSSRDLNSTYEYGKYYAFLEGRNYFNRLLNIRYRLGAVYLKGEVPVQSLGYFDASTAPWISGLSFKAMNYREYLGDKIYFLSFENHLGNLLWSKLGFIKKWDLLVFYNAGKSEISDANYRLVYDSYESKTRGAQNKNFLTTNNFYMEAGFGIGNIFDIIRLDFAWRLNNHIDGRNFGFKLSLLNF